MRSAPSGQIRLQVVRFDTDLRTYGNLFLTTKQNVVWVRIVLKRTIGVKVTRKSARQAQLYFQNNYLGKIPPWGRISVRNPRSSEEFVILSKKYQRFAQKTLTKITFDLQTPISIAEGFDRKSMLLISQNQKCCSLSLVQ